MPEANLIHSLSISDQSISTISINNTGDWIALGCGHLGQLLVWEWQSKTEYDFVLFIVKYLLLLQQVKHIL